MTEERTPLPGWYPASHANNELRYWTGTEWRPSQSAAPRQPEKSSFFRRPTSRRAAAWTAAGALAVGLAVGAATGGSSGQAATADLKTQVTSLQTEVADSISADDYDEAVADRDDAVEDAATLKADLSAVQAELETNKTELAAAHARVTELESTPAHPVTEPAPAAPVVQPAPTTPRDVSYKNCDAVRAAGAAPIHAGEPGYAAHLDRDGDGTGCE